MMATTITESEIGAGSEETTVKTAIEEPERRQLAARRQTSFSDAFNKITTNPFNRRRTTTLLQPSTTSAALNHPSRIPTPAGVPRSTSFFTNLSAFASKASSTNGGSEDSDQLSTIKPFRKVSDRLAQTPFFNHQHQRISTTPFSCKQKRESGVQIEQRGLMAPLYPPLPRSSTMGNLGQGQSAQNSPNTPGFMRSTSSSAARRTSINTPRNTHLPSLTSKNTPPSARGTPKHAPSRLVSGHRPPPLTVFSPSFGTPISEHRQASFGRISSDSAQKDCPSTNHSKIRTPVSRGRSPPSSHPLGKTGGLPSPKERRMGWCQGKSIGRRLASSRRILEYGADGTSESTVLSIGETVMEGTRSKNANEARSYSNTKSNIIAPASSSDESREQFSTPLSNAEEINIRELAKLTFDSEEEAAASPQSAELPFVLGDMTNPRLASLLPICTLTSPTSYRSSSLSLPLPHNLLIDPQIHTPLHHLEWTGRFVALSDRFRTNSLPSSTSTNRSTDTLTDTLHEPMHDEAQRNRRIWIHLHGLCVTDEARESLALYKVRMEEREKKMEGGVVKGARIREKHGFFQQLMGKKR